MIYDKNYFGPLPQVHPREAVYHEAKQALAEFLHDGWRQKFELTSAEFTCLLAQEIELFARILIGHERREST